MSEPKQITLAGMRKRIQRANKKAGIIASVGRPPKTQTFECKQDKDDEGVYNCEEITKEIKEIEDKASKTAKEKKHNPKKDFVKAPRARKPPRHNTINNQLDEQAQQFNEQQRAKEQAYAFELEKLRNNAQDKEANKINRQIDRQNVALGFEGVSQVMAEQEQNIGRLTDMAKKYLPHEFNNRGHKRPRQNVDNINNTLQPPLQKLSDIIGESPPMPTIESLPSKEDLEDQSVDAFGNPLLNISSRVSPEPVIKSIQQIEADIKASAEKQKTDDALDFIDNFQPPTTINLEEETPPSTTKNIDEPVVSDEPFQPIAKFQGTDPIIEEATQEADETQEAEEDPSEEIEGEVIDTDDDDEEGEVSNIPNLSERPFMFLESVPPKNNALFYLPKQLKQLPAEDKNALFKALGIRSDSAYTALRKERQKV